MCLSVAYVAIDGAIGSFDKKYTYLIPEKLKQTAKAGCRVTVPFGKGNMKKQGIILSLDNIEVDFPIKPILSVTDTEPILSDEMLKMCEWLHEQVFCTYFDAVHTMLPIGLNYKLSSFYSVNPEFNDFDSLKESEITIFDYIKNGGEVKENKLSSLDGGIKTAMALVKKNAVLKRSESVRKMGDKTTKFIRLIRDENELQSIKLTDRQKEIVELLAVTGSVSIKEVQYFTGVTLSVINALENKSVIECFEKEEFRMPYRLNSSQNRKNIVLNDAQQNAFNGIKQSIDSNSSNISLIYGVTGSGKTQVFLKLTDYVADMGKGVIIMVPEIALTPQMIKIFSDRYGDKIAVFHSAMSLGQRMDEYKRVKQGKALIAIGTRSAVFAPFSDLGLIVIDEEQEHTYKSEKSPRFHARDLAKFRASYHKCTLCLASATPSFESYSAALSGKYSLYTLPERYGDAILPEVQVVDMKKEILSGNSSAISRSLADAIYEELGKNKQIILLLNRRGHNTYVSCPKCGFVATCENCSVSMTYHSANGRIMCHYCGASIPMYKKCPECGSEHLSYSGVGTQKLEEDLSLLFPNARIARLDADSTVSRDSYSTVLGDFADGRYDILLGTQMVAKGLDFPNVTLVGVVGADHALYSDDYRGFERTFSLLTQVVGRAGRSGGGGRAIIQTVEPQSFVIELAKKQDYAQFYNEEVLSRKLMVFPPFCDICMVGVTSADKLLAKETSDEILDNIKNEIAGQFSDVKLIILGPCQAAIPRMGGRYRYRMIIKCRNTRRFREMLKKCIFVKQKKDVAVFVDINPENII